MSRGFEIAAPKVLMTSAENAGLSTLAPTEVFLPVGEEMFARAVPARGRGAARHDQRVPRARRVRGPDARSMRASRRWRPATYAKAETHAQGGRARRRDSSPLLAYLAATFAASGHDLEAASAWQTALVDGSDFPEIYEWLGDALMRIARPRRRRAMILEEAVAKWPSDERFTKPLALLYATFGQGREAVRTLERYLRPTRTTSPALYMGVEWIYHLHVSGTRRADQGGGCEAGADLRRRATNAPRARSSRW